METNERMNISETKISVVIPAFREGPHLAKSLVVIANILRQQPFEFELIVVDDGSDDDTWIILQKVAPRIRELRALSFARNFGKEAAIIAGLKHATGHAAVVIDADLQHPPDLIPKMVGRWHEEGFEIINAVKEYRGKESRWNRVAATAFYQIFEKLTGLKLMNGSDFKLIDRKIIDIYCNLPERYLFFRGIVPWFGFRQSAIPFHVHDRVAGEGKWNAMTRALLASNAFTSFSAVPLQFVTLAGIISLFVAFGLSIQTLYIWATGSAIEGFTTVILLVLAIGAVLMISLGIIGQYLAKIYDELKGRPRFLIDRKIGFDEHPSDHPSD
jgi:glycosyltransferase involved in cell wall biosynthesis